jgi:DNA polymerase-4
LWGVGAVTAEKLRRRGIATVGQVAELSQPELVALLGKAAGRHLYALARNDDPRSVRVGVRRRSIGAQRALGNRHRSPAELDAILAGLVERVARRLRAATRVCRTVTIRLRFADFTRATRSHTIAVPTSHTATILDAARRLLDAARPTIDAAGLTLIGVALSNLDSGDGALQLMLPLDRTLDTALDSTVDSVRDKFGTAAITRGTLLGKDPGISVPLLPD